MSNRGILMLTFVCCIWPIIFHFGLNWLMGYGKRIDWKEINWTPWRKRND